MDVCFWIAYQALMPSIRAGSICRFTNDFSGSCLLGRLNFCLCLTIMMRIVQGQDFATSIIRAANHRGIQRSVFHELFRRNIFLAPIRQISDHEVARPEICYPSPLDSRL